MDYKYILIICIGQQALPPPIGKDIVTNIYIALSMYQALF